MLESDDIAAGLIAQVSAFLGEHDPATTDRIEFLRARYAAGLAEVHYPAGDGGQGLHRLPDAHLVAVERAPARAQRERPMWQEAVRVSGARLE